jgi:hypothetical protein
LSSLIPLFTMSAKLFVTALFQKRLTDNHRNVLRAATAGVAPNVGALRSGERRIGGHFPYQIAIRIPKGAPRTMLAAMYQFCHARALPYRQFGGKRITVTD